MTLDSCKIPLDQDADGAIRVENTRVTLDLIVEAFNEGATAEEIADRYPVLSLSAVYAAIAFYLQNQVELETYFKQRRDEVAATRQALESRAEGINFRNQLLARRRSSE